MMLVDPREYISQRAAMRLLGISRPRLLQLARDLGVRQYQLPGSAARYHRADIQKIVADAVREPEPATATA